MKTLFPKFFFRYGISVIAVLLATLLLGFLHARINPTTVALVFLLIVLFSATFFGRNPALLASLAAMLCFNYFFLPPFFTWHIADPGNLVAWGAFTLTAVIAGELSAYARRRADEAERGKLEIGRLYRELQNAFEKASEAQALRRSEKLKSALLDAVTHDLRTPLTSIKASVTTLLESESGHRTIELDAESRNEFLEIINEETDRLNQFIEGMVELAKIEAKSLDLLRNWSEISEIIEAATSRAEDLLKDRRILLKSENELPLVQVDSKALAEVIYTLLDNAAKYSPAGSTIEIDVRRAENEMIEIAVSDEGQGVPSQWREKIFDKFFRVDELKTAGPTPKGLGLGLAIAKGIIEAHGGKISVRETERGKGAKFVVRVPIGDE
jgi:K+-sensing histidine kinase KdpD